MERWFGSFFSSRGVETSFAGLASTAPSRMRNWKKVRSAASLRAMEDFFFCASCSSESHSRMVMWSICFDVQLAALARARVGGREVFEELAEVDGVVPERVLAHVALVAQVFEELRDEWLHVRES